MSKVNIENVIKALNQILVLVTSIKNKERWIFVLIKLVPALKIKYKLLGAEIKDLDEEEVSELLEIITSYGYTLPKAEVFLNHLVSNGKVTIKSIINLMK